MGGSGGNGSAIADPPNSTSTKVKNPKAKKTKGKKKQAEDKPQSSLAGLMYQVMFHGDGVTAADKVKFKKDFPGVSLIPEDLRSSIRTVIRHAGKKILTEATKGVDKAS